MEYIRGSAVGVRIAGSLFGAGGAFISIVGAWGGTNWWIVLPFVSFFLYLLVRPWFMGVWIGDNTVAIQSWFRKYSFARGEVQSIDLEPYHGLVAISPIGWVPFAGQIRMLVVKRADEGVKNLPSTLSRRNRALRNARRIRVTLGLPGK